jgi:hypothetical protein
MTAHTIQLSEKTYALLLKQASRLQMTPEDVLERVWRTISRCRLMLSIRIP